MFSHVSFCFLNEKHNWGKCSQLQLLQACPTMANGRPWSFPWASWNLPFVKARLHQGSLHPAWDRSVTGLKQTATRPWVTVMGKENHLTRSSSFLNYLILKQNNAPDGPVNAVLWVLASFNCSFDLKNVILNAEAHYRNCFGQWPFPKIICYKDLKVIIFRLLDIIDFSTKMPSFHFLLH